MNLNGISNAYDVYGSYNTQASSKTTKKASEEKTSKSDNNGVVYESSNNSISNEALVAKLKSDSEQRINQLKSLVESMMTKQAGKATTLADLFKNLHPDAQTIKQAQEEISEDGYWGVNQTSDRIFEFAKALSGGDADKMDDMLNAFKKGFEQATKAWGDKLPDISSKTYDAVLEKFENYKNSLS